MAQIYLNKIRLTNFRNLSDDIIEFNSKINLIYGKNGNGKTNILEGIYYSLLRKSFRKKTSFEQFLSLDCEQTEILISSLWKEEENIFSMSGKISPGEAIWYKNNEILKNKINLFPIFINPYDSYQFHTSASFRREWIDDCISSINREYKQELKRFSITLKQRNKLLQIKTTDFRDQIKSLDDILSDSTLKIILKRKEFLQDLSSYFEWSFKELFDQKLSIKCEYQCKFKLESKEEIIKFYQQSLKLDEIIGKTKYAVHLDDFTIFINGMNSYEYSSLGQQKMSFLSLIFAYIELFRYKFKTNPIVLIDDVSGELDQLRWQNLVDYLKLKNFQVIITTANENFKSTLERANESKGINIEKGKVII